MPHEPVEVAPVTSARDHHLVPPVGHVLLGRYFVGVLTAGSVEG